MSETAELRANASIRPLLQAYEVNLAYINAGRGRESPFPVHIEQGGSRSGKTYKILQFLGPILFFSGRKGRNGSPFRVDIARKYSTLLDDAVNDFIEIMKAAGIWHPKEKAADGHQRWNPTRRIYNLDNIVWHFYGITNEADARGPKRDILFINEGTELGGNVFKQLRRRIREFIVIDYNPSSKFWVHDLYIDDDEVHELNPFDYNPDEVDPDEVPDEDVPMSYSMLITTYKDNDHLDDVTIRALLEDNKDPYFAQVYLHGQLGVWQGQIYKHWTPEFNYKEWERYSHVQVFGMDFGTNDPTTLIEVRVGLDGVVRLWEHFYQSNLSPNQLLQLMDGVQGLRRGHTYADHERWIKGPMKDSGYRNVHNAWKSGKGMNKIDQVRMIQRLGRIEYHGENIDYEVNRYEFKKDRDGNPVYGVLPDGNDHAMDAARYGLFCGVRAKLLRVGGG